jgi:V8-like Glu-specific endopeptidase
MLIDSTIKMDREISTERWEPGSEYVGALTIKLSYRGPADYPFTAICYVESTFKDGYTSRGTGAMVGPNDVLTAGQMLWDAEHGGTAVSVKVIPGYHDGVAPFGSYQGALFSYYPIDQDGNGLVNHDESQYDVGIIGLSTKVGAQTGWFGLETHPLTGPNSDPEALTLTGYPAIFDGARGPRMMNDYIGVSPNDKLMTFDYASATADIRPGDLGAPLWLEGHGSIHNGDNGPYILGVSSTYGWAADITKTFDQIMAWMKGNDYLLG